MRIERLAIQGVRNLHSVGINPAPFMNLFYGDNASGKTSLLEALYILSCGKSFRTSQLAHVVQRGSAGFSIAGFLRGEEDLSSVTLGVELRHRRLKMRAGTQTLRSMAQLASHLPVVVIHQESPRLLTEGPRLRRQYLNWGLFHVEQSFHSAWQTFMRCLKQRNRALQERAPLNDVRAWEETLSESAGIIHGLRQRFLEELLPVLRGYVQTLLPRLGELEIEYRPGWQAQSSLKESLETEIFQDQARGFTQSGPHRADLVMKIDGINARERVSRGQQKLLVCALYLAQAAVYKRRNGKPCVLLVDDVTAELDSRHRDLLLALLRELEVQVFFTATAPLPGDAQDMIEKMFHVKHGQVLEVV